MEVQMNEGNNHLLDVGIISAIRETESLYEVEFTNLSRLPSHHITAPPLGHT
jgi:hypothetical protein